MGFKGNLTSRIADRRNSVILSMSFRKVKVEAYFRLSFYNGFFYIFLKIKKKYNFLEHNVNTETIQDTYIYINIVTSALTFMLD